MLSSTLRYLWKTGGQLISCCSTPSSRTRWIVPNWFRSSEPPKRNSTRPTKRELEKTPVERFFEEETNPTVFVIYLFTFDLEKERLWPRMPGGGWELLLLYCMLFRCLFHDKKSLTNADFLLQFVCWICVFYKYALFFLKLFLLLYLGINWKTFEEWVDPCEDGPFFLLLLCGIWSYELRYFVFSVYASFVLVMDSEHSGPIAKQNQIPVMIKSGLRTLIHVDPHKFEFLDPDQGVQITLLV